MSGELKSSRFHSIRIATRSSGIKQHHYGNIEGIVVKVKTVTSIGTGDKTCTPRCSMGPEIDHLMFGSEGTMGVITEAVIKIHKIPEVKRYGSLLFPDFPSGLKFIHECARKNCLPSSLRLVDNFHYKFGRAFKYYNSVFKKFIDAVVFKALPFLVDENQCCFASFLIEGNKLESQQLEDKILSIASFYGAINGGPAHGEKGYQLTILVGYMRVRIRSVYQEDKE